MRQARPWEGLETRRDRCFANQPRFHASHLLYESPPEGEVGLGAGAPGWVTGSGGKVPHISQSNSLGHVADHPIQKRIECGAGLAQVEDIAERVGGGHGAA